MAEENKDKQNRRKFLQNVGLFGTGAVVGATALYEGFEYEHKKKAAKKVTVLTAHNETLEVNEEDLQKVSPKYALNQSEFQKRGRAGLEGKRWTMVIDLAKCQNARRCVASCQAAHQLKPEQYHMNILQMQDTPDTEPYFMPKNCQHCDNPPCVSVCPVDATYKRPDGIVLIDNQRCIGCRFCIAACPYSARIFHWTEPREMNETERKLYGERGELYDVEQNVPQRKGTISKCVLSADKLRQGKLPSCVSACPNGVYWFGDQNEDSVTNGTSKETRRLSQLLAENAGYTLMPELGTQPRVYYLSPKDRTKAFPEDLKEELKGKNEHHS